MEKIIAIIGCVVSLASIAVAIASYRYSKAKGARKADETEMLRAPLLQISSYAINGREYELKRPQDSGKPHAQQFSLDRRTFVQMDTKKESSYYSFYMNTTRSNAENDVELLAIGTLHIKNVGYWMASFEVEKVDITLLNGKYIVLLPRQVENKPVHNVLNMADETVEIFVSFRLLKEGDYRVFKYDADWERKRQAAGDNLLNVYMPGELSCDLWEMITITCITCNMHNEHYRQEFNMINTDGVITASSRLLERVKEK